MASWRGSQAASGSRCVVSVVLVLVAGCSGGESSPPTSSTSPNAPPMRSFRNGVLEAYVKASNPGSGFVLVEGIPRPFGDGFGTSIALNGETLVVGAPSEESCATGINGDQTNNGCPAAGALYVFTRTSETWSQQAYIKASDAHATGGLGNLVAISGNTIAATGTPANGAKVIYVFTRTNGSWSQQAMVTPINPPQEYYAFSLALDGDTLVVGDLTDSTCASGINGDSSVTGCAVSGAVYVFRRTNGVWAQEAYIKPPNRRDNIAYAFGYSVAISGDTLVVGAPSEGGCATGVNGDESAIGCFISGAVYVYTRKDGVWTKEAYIKSSVTSRFSGNFGISVALSADTLAVIGNDEDYGGRAVYVFTRTNGTWTQQAFIKASNADRNAFGVTALAILADTLALASYGENSCATGINGNQDDHGCDTAGAVYLFERRAGAWTQEAYVKATNTEPGDQFGLSVALSDGTVAVGATGEDSCAKGINGNQMDNNCPMAGAVYVYKGR